MIPISLGKIGIGPMSSEIIEAVFKYSENNSTPLMLVVSKNQIDWDGGYVNNWNTKQFMAFIAKKKRVYPSSAVTVCRDHCGPGFKNNDVKDVYRTIASDIELGFDLIHIDFCKWSRNHEEVLRQTKKAIEFITKRNSQILIEVGTDENKGEFISDLPKIKKEIDFFTSIAPVKFFVAQTGSLVKEINQVGGFNKNFIGKVKKIVNKKGVYLKEHNGDYLTTRQIIRRKGYVDAINVAPQYGVLQTHITLQKCITYGIDYTDFLQDAYKSKKWKKWLHHEAPHNKFLCSLIAGHYVFSGVAYQRIYEQLNKYTDVKEDIMKNAMETFSLYTQSL